jgi:hypothetical protein
MKLTTLLLIIASCAAMAAPAFTLSKAKPLQLATAIDATPAEKTAAMELHDYILKLCGAECKITNEKDVQTPADDHTAGWPPYNAFYAAIPVKNHLGNIVTGSMDYFESQYTTNRYASMTLVSVKNYNESYGSTEYYYWMIIEAHE